MIPNHGATWHYHSCCDSTYCSMSDINSVRKDWCHKRSITNPNYKSPDNQVIYLFMSLCFVCSTCLQWTEYLTLPDQNQHCCVEPITLLSLPVFVSLLPTFLSSGGLSRRHLMNLWATSRWLLMLCHLLLSSLQHWVLIQCTYILCSSVRCLRRCYFERVGISPPTLLTLTSDSLPCCYLLLKSCADLQPKAM